MIQIRVKPDGKWHRRGQPGATACGEPYGAYTSRDHELDGDLCEVCFTPTERDTGEFHKIAADLQRESDPSLYFDPDDEPTDPDADVPDK